MSNVAKQNSTVKVYNQSPMCSKFNTYVDSEEESVTRQQTYQRPFVNLMDCTAETTDFHTNATNRN